MMKIVYVGDNRNRDNFGCRATSTALSQIISAENEIVGRIYGHYTNGDIEDVFFNKRLKEKDYLRFAKGKHWGFTRKFMILLFQLIGISSRNKMPTYDFVSYDWDRAIENLKKCLPANPVIKECDLDQYVYDALVVNGEGSFIFSKTPWREALVETMLMYWALKQGKKVFYMNGMFSAGSGEDLNMETISNVKPVLEQIQYLGTREKWSYDFAKKYFPKANIHMYPDALFSWYELINDEFVVENGKYFMGYSGAFDETYTDYDFTKPYICVSGSSSRKMGVDVTKTIESYCNLVNSLKSELNLDVYIVEACSGDAFLRNVAEKTGVKFIPVDTPIVAVGKILAGAKIYVTGRYHPAILASLGGTPCIFMGSNSHKNASLQEVLDYQKITNFNEIPSEDEIKKMTEYCKNILIDEKYARVRIKKRVEFLSQQSKKMGQELKKY